MLVSKYFCTIKQVLLCVLVSKCFCTIKQVFWCTSQQVLLYLKKTEILTYTDGQSPVQASFFVLVSKYFSTSPKIFLYQKKTETLTYKDSQSPVQVTADRHKHHVQL